MSRVEMASICPSDPAFESGDPLGYGYGEEDLGDICEELAIESGDPLGYGYREEDLGDIREELAIESSDPLGYGYGEEDLEDLGESYTDDAEWRRASAAGARARARARARGRTRARARARVRARRIAFVRRRAARGARARSDYTRDYPVGAPDVGKPELYEPEPDEPEPDEPELEEPDLDEPADAELDADSLSLAEAFGEAFGDEYAYATPDELDAGLLSVQEALTPAEAINFTSALRQIRKGATRALTHPTVAQLAASGIPLAGAAAGTLLGGPAGTAMGSKLGAVAAKALSGGPPAAVPPPAAAPQGSSVAGGSTAAAQGAVLSQQPEVIKSMMALALGDKGRSSVAGIPVGDVMQMLSTIFGKAAEDAEELRWMDDGQPGDAEDLYADPASPEERAQALYSALLDAENQHLTEASEAR
jgi:hypothetical protein